MTMGILAEPSGAGGLASDTRSAAFASPLASPVTLRREDPLPLEPMLYMQHMGLGTMECCGVAGGLINEMSESCIVTRTRVISRVVSGIYDDALREFGINSPQFILLVIVSKIGPVTRAALGRFHQQERSTLTRNLKIMLENGWIEEVADGKDGRGRPLAASAAGLALLETVEPAWRASQAEALKMLGDAGVGAMFEIGNSLIGISGLD